MAPNRAVETVIAGKGFDVGVFLMGQRGFPFFNIFITLLIERRDTFLKEWMEEANCEGLLCLLEGLVGLDCEWGGVMGSMDIIEMMEGNQLLNSKK